MLYQNGFEIRYDRECLLVVYCICSLLAVIGSFTVIFSLEKARTWFFAVFFKLQHQLIFISCLLSPNISVTVITTTSNMNMLQIMERFNRITNETKQIVETDRKINPRLIHYVEHPEDIENRTTLDELKDRLERIGTFDPSKQSITKTKGIQPSKPRNLQTAKYRIYAKPKNNETECESSRDSSVEILNHSPSQHPNPRTQSIRSNHSNDSNRSIRSIRSTPSNRDQVRKSVNLQIGVQDVSQQNVKGAVPPNHCLIPQPNGTEQVLSGTSTPGFGTDSEPMNIGKRTMTPQSPGIQTIEVSDCDFDHLSAERDNNLPVPKWCDSQQKILEMSRRNQTVDPSEHFGDVSNVCIDLREVMGKYYGKYKKKAVSSWKDDVVTEEEKMEYMKFQGWME